MTNDTLAAGDTENQLALARRQLEAVQRISTALYSVTDTDTLLRQALDVALEVVGADAGSILLYNADKNMLVFRHAVGPVAASLLGTGLDLSLGKGIAGDVFRTGTGRLTPDVERDADHIGTVDARTGYRTRSLMTVPLNTRQGLPLGVIQFVNKRSGEFDAGDMAVGEIVGSLVALSLQNALLAREANLAAVARLVGEISHDIGNMLTHVLPYVETLEGCIADVRAGEPGALDSLESFYAEVRENVAEGVQRVTARTREIASALKGEVAPLDFKPGRPFDTAQRVAQSLVAAAQRAGIAPAWKATASWKPSSTATASTTPCTTSSTTPCPRPPTAAPSPSASPPTPPPTSTASPWRTRAGGCRRRSKKSCSPTPPFPPSPAGRGWGLASSAASSSSTAACPPSPARRAWGRPSHCACRGRPRRRRRCPSWEHKP